MAACSLRLPSKGKTMARKGRSFRLLVEWRILGQVIQLLAQELRGRRREAGGDRVWSPGSLSPCSQHMFPSLCISLLLVC